ncbi:MAG: hypothetical protein ACRD35_09500 [Candidatus Acidiferrales bacterium]
MRQTTPSRFILLSSLILATAWLAAQDAQAQARVRPPAMHRTPGVVGQVFVPGIGLRPVIQFQDSFPNFGLGFDAHHFFVTRGRFGFHSGFRTGFIGGGFSHGPFSGFGFLSSFVPIATSSTTLIIVPQPSPVQVITLEDGQAGEPSVVAAGLPDDWPRLRLAADSLPRERAPLAQLTLLVLKDQTIIPATEYWLEDGRVFYVTSTGRQDSFEVRDLDWEMTTELNAQRNVDFVLRAPR